jgi:CubicO group peptidase (beta-lactamase class C family)
MNVKRLLHTIVLILLATSCATSKSEQTGEPGPPESVEEAVGRSVEPLMAATPAPTAIVAGVTVGGVRHVYSFGAVDGVPPDANTRFPIGTATEPIMATLLATYVASGEIDYDESIGTRSCKSTHVTAFCFRGDAATYRHVVQHVAGLPKDAAEESAQLDLDGLNTFLARYELGLSPGNRFRQSSVGYAALGAILRRRFGEAPEELTRVRVLEPLGMAHTTFGPAGGVAPGYHDGQSVPPPVEKGVFSWSRGLVSDASDLLSFLEVNVEPAAREDLGEAIRQTQRVSDEIEVFGDSRAANGWFYHVEQRVYWHNGAADGYRAFLGFDRDSDIGVVILTNESSADGADLDAAGLQMLRHIQTMSGG